MSTQVNVATRLRVHFVTLPRWFAAPITVFGVLLGVSLTGQWPWTVWLAVLVGLTLMAYGHSWNSFHDYVFTKFDQGEDASRSLEKVYTGGQSVIARGLITPVSVLLNSLCWLLLSAVLAAILSAKVGPFLWIPWALAALCAPWYSEAKLRWHPELPLGLGFGPVAVWLGMSVSGGIDWWTGFLASLPFFLLFGVVAEHVDQYIDYEANWPKGGRSLGMLVARLKIPLVLSTLILLGITYIVQGVLIQRGVLSSSSALSLIGLAFFLAFALLLNSRFRIAVLLGLAGIFAAEVGIVVGQVIA